MVIFKFHQNAPSGLRYFYKKITFLYLRMFIKDLNIHTYDTAENCSCCFLLLKINNRTEYWKFSHYHIMLKSPSNGTPPPPKPILKIMCFLWNNLFPTETCQTLPQVMVVEIIMQNSKGAPLQTPASTAKCRHIITFTLVGNSLWATYQ